ncbi:unnamed protein product [Brachionus calyciflorus]|uniref:Zinc finger MYND domain-containing protein 10 n=1 Tax=Brachionus calyciflorus TaxID=104777 RepID=A0A813Y6A1_9BILA|nr:unnamed protein product [Brachionus calyciflorus]
MTYNNNNNNNNGQTPGCVLLSTEVELYVQALQAYSIEEIGSRKWSSQHEFMEKLNMQAILSASANETEYVKDSLVTFEKMPILIHELITIELWSEKIFSQLFKIDFKPKNSFVIYLILYHEATIVNLLETILFHSEVIQAMEDSIYDLIDYIQRKISNQIRLFQLDQEASKAKIKSIEDKSDETDDPLKELSEQHKKIQFEIVMKLYSILRYIIDNLSNLPFGVTNRILNKHDFIMILVQSIDLSLWSKIEKDGRLLKFIENKWKPISANERFQLTKIEGQIWISLYELLLNPQCLQKYDYTEFKKNQVLKLRSHLNEVVIDQIPNLAHLQRFLEQLAISEPPPYKSELIIEPIAEIYEGMIAKYKGKWKEIAKTQASTVLNPNDKEIQEKAKRWTETFSSDVLESLIDEPARCAECGQPAPKRCSRCQNEWYCRRECQVKNWPKHKKACELIYETIKSAAANSK